MNNLTEKEKAKEFDKLIKNEKKNKVKTKIKFKFKFSKYFLHSFLIILVFLLCLTFMIPINKYSSDIIKIVAWSIYSIVFCFCYIGYFLLMYFKTRTHEILNDENYISSIRLINTYKREVKLAKTNAKLQKRKLSNKDINSIKISLYDRYIQGDPSLKY